MNSILLKTMFAWKSRFNFVNIQRASDRNEHSCVNGTLIQNDVTRNYSITICHNVLSPFKNLLYSKYIKKNHPLFVH